MENFASLLDFLDQMLTQAIKLQPPHFFLQFTITLLIVSFRLLGITALSSTGLEKSTTESTE